MNIYTVTAPDGSKLTRKSNRVYTHAVISKCETRGKWFAGYNSSFELALKQAAKERTLEGWSGTVVVEVEVA